VTDEDPVISYTVRDLIADLRSDLRAEINTLRAGLDRIEAKLDAKADRAELRALTDRVTALETAETKRSGGTEVTTANDQARIEWRRWALPTVLAAAVVVIGVLQIILR
jgi:hypothetical protein